MRYIVNRLKSQHLIILISFLMYLPLVLWGGYFLDDNYRSIEGYYAWSGDYRPIADYVYYALGLGEDFIDTYPLNYIIQFGVVIVFVRYFLEHLIRQWSINTELTNYIVLAVFCVFLNPFFIQNLYFRYDSLPMLLAVMLIMNLLIVSNKKIHLISLVIALLLYQPAVIGYGIITCLRTIRLSKCQQSKKNVYLEIIENILLLLFSACIFYILSISILMPNSYASSHFILVDSLISLYQNFYFSINNLYFSNLLTDYGIVFGLCFFAIVYMSKIIFSNYHLNLVDKIIIFLGILLVIFISTININIFLQIPRLHSRTYVPIGFVIFFIMFMSILFFNELKNSKEFKKYSYIVLFCFFYLFITLMNIYYISYNYNREMERYTNNILKKIEDDISNLNLAEINTVVTNGTVKESDRANVLSKRFPIVKLNYSHKFDVTKHRALIPLLQNDSILVKEIGLLVPKYRQQYNNSINAPANLTNNLYDIVVTDNNVFIYFKEEGKRMTIPINVVKK